MGLAVSAQDMILAARRLTGTETLDEANAFITNAEALMVLNGELAELEDLINENADDDYSRSTYRFTASSGISIYPLPFQAYKIISVDVTWSNGVVRDAKRFTEAERNRFRTFRPAWSHNGRVYFRPIGDNLEFIPTPLSTVTIDVNYLPAFTPISSLSETYNSQNGWHMAAVWGLAAAIYLKDDNEAGAAFCDAQKEKQKARVRALAASRVSGEPPRVQRVRNVGWEEDDF
jgi:hypothetical protein